MYNPLELPEGQSPAEFKESADYIGKNFHCLETFNPMKYYGAWCFTGKEDSSVNIIAMFELFIRYIPIKYRYKIRIISKTEEPFSSLGTIAWKYTPERKNVKRIG